MSPPKRFEYHRIAKAMGVPNIILTGIEKKVKMEFPDDEEQYACHVLKTLKVLADEYSGNWMDCDLDSGNLPPGARGIFKE